MPYREPSEATPVDAPSEAASPLVCSACEVPVAEDEDPRCPKCLRKTTVVDTRLGLASKAVAGLAANAGSPEKMSPAVWPATRTCPVCAKAPIDASVVYLRVSKTASDFGSTTASAFFRVCVCSACLAEVRRHDTLRYVCATGLVLGMLGTIGLVTGEAAGTALGIASVALAVASLGGFVARNRRLRAHLDRSAVTATVAAALPTPRGLFEWENASLHASLPEGREALDLAHAVGQLTGDD